MNKYILKCQNTKMLFPFGELSKAGFSDSIAEKAIKRNPTLLGTVILINPDYEEPKPIKEPKPKRAEIKSEEPKKENRVNSGEGQKRRSKAKKGEGE